MYDLAFNLIDELKYYPSFEDGVFCILSGLAPETRRQIPPYADPQQWAYDTLLDCCQQRFEYDMDACMKSGGHADPTGPTGECPPERTGEL